jgi:hypothetical protein
MFLPNERVRDNFLRPTSSELARTEHGSFVSHKNKAMEKQREKGKSSISTIFQHESPISNSFARGGRPHQPQASPIS